MRITPMLNVSTRFAALALLICAPAFAETYHVDPAKGAADGDGSAAKPWKTLEEVASSGQLAKLKGGDTVLLKSGYHGDVKFAGDNEAPITIAADKGQKPQLSHLVITKGKNWIVKGLIISPTFSETEYKGDIVSFGESGESSKITVEDCYIFGAEDTSNFDAQQWMDLKGAMQMGRNGRDLTARNNYIRNVRFGISATSFDSLIEGNVVTDYSADGIRLTRDGQTAQYNIIKNVYVSAKDGDKNHDDGIQCFLFNAGKGELKNLTVVGNLIIAHENPNQKLQNTLQGIGFFDGPLVNFVVTDNVVGVDSWHGISLYDAQGCRVENNVVWTPEGPMRAWIMFSGKKDVAGGGLKDNIARNNFAPTLKLDVEGVTAEKNKQATQKIYDDAKAKAIKTINEKFGEKHVAADRPRIETK
jgi:hypothetical protein